MLPSASCTCTYHARTVYGFDDGVYPLVVSENYDLPIGHHHAAALSVPVPGRDDSSIVLSIGRQFDVVLCTSNFLLLLSLSWSISLYIHIDFRSVQTLVRPAGASIYALATLYARTLLNLNRRAQMFSYHMWGKKIGRTNGLLSFYLTIIALRKLRCTR